MYPAILLLHLQVSERDISYANGNVPVILGTQLICVFIRWCMTEKLAILRRLNGKSTTKLTYLGTLLLNPLVAYREVKYAYGNA